MRSLVIATLVVAACGTDSQTIELSVPGTQVLVTEKLNSGPWQKLSGQFDGETNKTTYSIEIGDEYELVVVCMRSGPLDAGQVVSGQLFGTSDDADVTLGSWDAPNCLRSPGAGVDPIGPQVTVSGTFDETMDLSLGARLPIHVTGGHPFAFSADSGQHDLLAHSDTKFLIQRNVNLAGDTTLAPIHVTSDGIQMLVVDVDLSGDQDEGMPYVSDGIVTPNGSRLVIAAPDPHAALFVPVQALAPGDVQSFEIGFFDTKGERLLDLEDPSRLADATLLPRLAPATFHADSLGATWSPIEAFYTSATVSAEPSMGGWQSVTASRSWLDRHGKTTLDFDLAIDGFDPAWNVTSATFLTLTRWSPGNVAMTATFPGVM